MHAVVEFDSAVCVREVLLRLKGTFKAGKPLTLFDSEGATELEFPRVNTPQNRCHWPKGGESQIFNKNISERKSF